MSLLPLSVWGQASASLSLDGAKAEEAAALSLFAEAQKQAAQARQRCEQLQRECANPALGQAEVAPCRQLCEDLLETTEALAYWREHFQPLSHLASTRDAQPHLRQGSYEALMAAQRYDLEGVCLRLQQLLLQADQLLQAVE